MIKKTGIPAIDKDTEKLEKLQARSEQATGLVGKLFTLPHADSCAYYTVEEEKGQKVRVLNHALYDAWQDDLLGAGGWVSRKQIESLIRRNEHMTKMFDQMHNEQKSEKKKVARAVGTAAFVDLGSNVDVYTLASWAWNRSRRGTVKDERIIKNGMIPWANDIASALIDSDIFPALQALKEPVVFIMLADKFQDPIVYANKPPSDAVMLTAVTDAFLVTVGAAPSGLYLVENESKYLDKTVFVIMNAQSEKVGSVTFDPATGKILRVGISFQVDDKKGVSQ